MRPYVAQLQTLGRGSPRRLARPRMLGRRTSRVRPRRAISWPGRSTGTIDSRCAR